MFPNNTAREHLLDNYELPLQLLVPHIYCSHIEFKAISNFILTVMSKSQFDVQKLPNLTKDYSVITTKKLALNYVQSHRAYLSHKSDKLKIKQYLL